MSEQLGSRKGLQTKDIVLCGILMALTTVMTMIVQIPVIGAHGYVNMGDTVVLFTALYLGKKEGAIVGGLGSALADLISGYHRYTCWWYNYGYWLLYRGNLYVWSKDFCCSRASKLYAGHIWYNYFTSNICWCIKGHA